MSGKAEQDLSGESTRLSRRALGVGIIVVRDEEVLLGLRRGVQRWRHLVGAGDVESGENPEAAARRELREETGLEAGATRVVAETDDVFPSGLRYRTFFVRVDGVVDQPVVREPEACKRWGWFPWNALPQPLFLLVATLRANGFQP
jgi:8-oxo-dGTP diphosphatase